MVNHWNGGKCDLHRHLGGSISPSTVAEIMHRSGRGLPLATISRRMICDTPDIGFAAFLDKFVILNEIPWPDWAIELSIKQVCQDIAAEGISYSEISFSIGKYISTGRKPADAVQLISRLFKHYSEQSGIAVGLLLSIQYHSPRELQLIYADLIDNPKVRESLCGLDLIGDESCFDVDFYKPIFDKWRSHNIGTLRAHVGEMPGTSKNIRIAIEQLGATSIAHGIQASNEDLKIASEHQICFDLALRSNTVTGAWGNLQTHPIKRMLEAGCILTLNTDDPIQFSCTLDDEFKLAAANKLITKDQTKQIMHNAWAVSHYNRNT